jgi:uncharacterized glyoxalase superfamily protein PhnB
MSEKENIKSAFFITFSGNCKKALTIYQACFGGVLHFDTFDKPIDGIKDSPIVSGSLISEKMTIHGSDLVHNQGRQIGNHIAIYIACDSHEQRLYYLQKLDNNHQYDSLKKYSDQKLIEIVDAFNVAWIFGV